MIAYFRGKKINVSERFFACVRRSMLYGLNCREQIRNRVWQNCLHGNIEKKKKIETSITNLQVTFSMGNNAYLEKKKIKQISKPKVSIHRQVYTIRCFAQAPAQE